MPVPSLLDTQLRLGGEEAEKAKTTIHEALTTAKGMIPATAEALGVSTRTLFRLLQRTELTDVAAELRVKSGVPRVGRGPQRMREEAPTMTSKSQKKTSKKKAKRRAARAEA